MLYMPPARSTIPSNFFPRNPQVIYFIHLEPISYGRTKDRYITRERGHLSFPNAAIVTVLAKQATVDVSGREMWLVEVSTSTV